MLEDLRDLLERDPFDPFRIKLENGDFHDIVDPNLFEYLDQSQRCFYASRDGHWVVFALGRIVSLESLLAGEY